LTPATGRVTSCRSSWSNNGLAAGCIHFSTTTTGFRLSDA
jgi:hypothetical protein